MKHAHDSDIWYLKQILYMNVLMATWVALKMLCVWYIKILPNFLALFDAVCVSGPSICMPMFVHVDP